MTEGEREQAERARHEQAERLAKLERELAKMKKEMAKAEKKPKSK